MSTHPGSRGTPYCSPCGSWPTPVTLDRLIADASTFGEISAVRDRVYFLQARPDDDGRRTILCWTHDAGVREVLPPGYSAGSSVYGYGGGAYVGVGQKLYFANRADGGLYELTGEAPEPRLLLMRSGWKFGDLRTDAAGRTLFAVLESAQDEHKVEHELVAISTVDGTLTTLVSGSDFYAAPRPSSDGRYFAWISWSHPWMPWDETQLWVAEFTSGRELRAPRLVAGASGSIIQPEWHTGSLYFLSDRSGWWNLYRWAPVSGEIAQLTNVDADIGDPPWTLGRASYAVLPSNRVALALRRDARDRLYLLDTDGTLVDLKQPYTEIEGVRSDGISVFFLAATPGTAPELIRVDPESRRPSVLARSSPRALQGRFVSRPRHITFTTRDGSTCHALFYAPRSPGLSPLPGELPPLVVRMHGGPTSSAWHGLNLAVQMLTTRGIAVVDVDYRGSAGYGRAYRQALYGRWGRADVGDCVEAASFLARSGSIDPTRMVITGSSAGGFTALMALAEGGFRGAAVHFPVVDLQTLASATHKFESHYVDRLIGSLVLAPDASLSPLERIDSLRNPILVTHGMEDTVVSPLQTQILCALLDQARVPHAVRYFEGEGHGYRHETSLREMWLAELGFYATVFGVTMPDIPRLDLRVTHDSTA